MTNGLQPLRSRGAPSHARSRMCRIVMQEQRLHEFEQLRHRAREIKLFKLTEEEGNFLRGLHYKPTEEFTREEETRLRDLVRLHWRKEE